MFTERDRISRQARAEARLIGELSVGGSDRLYTDEDLGNRLTFLSGERIIGTDPYQGIYLSMPTRWTGPPTPAYLFPAENPGFEAEPAGLGDGYRKIDPWFEGSDCSPISVPHRKAGIPDRRRWKAASNVEGGSLGKGL